jgi:NAD(P)-dependent dehydrogenase (short-subunit alcohol dehydrogenase family)
MSFTHGALVVFGSGPGVGRNVAALFAERGFEKVILISRNATRLAQDADFVRSACAGVSVHETPFDLGKSDEVQKGLEKVNQSLRGTSLECVLFNAARLGKSPFFEFSAESLENDLRVRSKLLFSSLMGILTVITTSIDLCRQSVYRGSVGDASTTRYSGQECERYSLSSSDQRYAGQRSIAGYVLPCRLQSRTI